MKRKIKKRFQDHFMQKTYEDLVRSGVHWKVAERKTRKAYREYDNQ